MSNKQFIIGNTEKFGEDLNNKDGVTLIGPTGIGNKKLAQILAAASEAKHKDGIVHIDALTLQAIILELLENRLPDNIAIGSRFSAANLRSDAREMAVASNNE